MAPAGFDRLFAGGVALLVFLLVGRLLMLPVRIPLSYNEGWNAYLAVRAVFSGSGPLYPQAGGFVFNNYPPLSFYLVGVLGRLLFGDMIVAGRVVALLSLLGSSVLVGFCVRRLGGSLRGSGAASIMLLLLTCAFYRDYVAVDDPQWLAQLLMLAGFAWLLRNPMTARLPRRDVAIACLLVVAGGFVKHNLVGLPLAITAWIALLNRSAFLVWIASAAFALVSGAACVAVLFGHAAFTDVLQHRRILHITRLPRFSLDMIPLVPMAVFAVRDAAPRWRRDPAALFTLLFLSSSTLLGLAQRAGEGVSYNACFETMVAASLGFGLAVSQSFARPTLLWGRRITPTAMTLLAALPLILMAPKYLPRTWHEMSRIGEQRQFWRPIIARMAHANGPVMCETLALCYWAGKPESIDLFNLGQSILTGAMPVATVRAALAGPQRFKIIEYQLQSPIHNDAMLEIRRDPIEDLVVGQCSVIAVGHHGVIVIAPDSPGPSGRRG